MSKKLFILLVVFVLAILFWMSAKTWLASTETFSLSPRDLWPVVTLVILAACVGLAFLLISESWLRNLIFILVALPAVVIFGVTRYLPGVLALTFIFHVMAIRRIKDEVKQRIKINIRAAMRKALPLIIIPILMVISFAYYLDPVVQATASKKELPSNFRDIITATVDIFLGNQIINFPSSEIGPARKQIIDQVMGQFTDFISPFAQYFPPFLAFGLFLVLVGFNLIFVWLGTWLAVLIFEILKIIKFVKIIEKTATVEEFVVT